MRRRAATIERDIPLVLIPHIVMRGVRKHGEDLERVIVRKTRSHFYNVRIRTRPIKREQNCVKKTTTGTPGSVTREDGGSDSFLTIPGGAMHSRRARIN